jgi:hypothetical protein
MRWDRLGIQSGICWCLGRYVPSILRKLEGYLLFGWNRMIELIPGRLSLGVYRDRN